MNMGTILGLVTDVPARNKAEFGRKSVTQRAVAPRATLARGLRSHEQSWGKRRRRDSTGNLSRHARW